MQIPKTISTYKPYSEKLKDPRWQKKRLEILSSADFTCVYCGNKNETLHVHHFMYIKGKEPWDYSDGDLACICKDCHAISHAKNLPGIINDLFCVFICYDDKKPIQALIHYLKTHNYIK